VIRPLPLSDSELAVAFARYREKASGRLLDFEGFKAAVDEGQQCRCGCGKRPAPREVYAVGNRCRQRAYDNRRKAQAAEAGVLVRPNLAQLKERTGRRSADAPAPARKPRKRNPDLRISYRKAVEAFAAHLAANYIVSISDEDALTEARRQSTGVLQQLLSAMQRAALDRPAEGAVGLSTPASTFTDEAPDRSLSLMETT
jgi:hypothetical protein